MTEATKNSGPRRAGLLLAALTLGLAVAAAPGALTAAGLESAAADDLPPYLDDAGAPPAGPPAADAPAPEEQAEPEAPAQAAEPAPATEPDPMMVRIGQQMDRLEGGGGAGARTADAGEGAGVDGGATRRTLWDLMFRTVFALCVTVALMLICYAVYLKYGEAFRKLTGRALPLGGMPLGRVTGRLALGGKAMLYFVQTGDRLLVVGVTPNHIALLTELTGADLPEEADRQPGPAADEDGPRAPHDFMTQLREHVQATPASGAATATQSGPQRPFDEEFAAMRQEIERLRAYVAESEREARTL